MNLFMIKIFSIILMTGFHTPGKPDQLKFTSIIRYGDFSFSTNRIIKTSPGLFSLLNYDLIQHNSNRMRGYSVGVVLPLKTKIRLFGDSQAIGKVIVVDSCEMEIVGIMKDVPEKSCLYCDLIILSSEKEVSVEALTNIRGLIIL